MATSGVVAAVGRNEMRRRDRQPVNSRALGLSAAIHGLFVVGGLLWGVSSWPGGLLLAAGAAYSGGSLCCLVRVVDATVSPRGARLVSGGMMLLAVAVAGSVAASPSRVVFGLVTVGVWLVAGGTVATVRPVWTFNSVVEATILAGSWGLLGLVAAMAGIGSVSVLGVTAVGVALFSLAVSMLQTDSWSLTRMGMLLGVGLLTPVPAAVVAGWGWWPLLVSAAGSVLVAADRHPSARRRVFGLPDGVMNRRRWQLSVWIVACGGATILGGVVSTRSSVSVVVLWALLLMGLVAAMSARWMRDLEAAVSTDPLTKVMSRDAFRRELGGFMRRLYQPGATVAVIGVDLDDFKRVNDTLGHSYGDALLVEVAARLGSALPAGWKLGRFGGDEFVAAGMVGGHDPVGVAQRIVDIGSDPVMFRDGTTWTVRCSAGVTVSQDPLVPLDVVLGEADAALYDAKHGGRGQVKVFSEQMRTHIEEAATVERSLRAAVRDASLLLRLEPVIDFGSERLVAGYATAGWEHPKLGMLWVNDAVSERTIADIAVTVDEWAIRAALGAAAGNPRISNVVVPCSTQSLSGDGFVSMVAELADAGGAGVTLAVPVRGLLANVFAQDTVAALRALGVRVAVTGFGVEPVAVAQVLRLDVDELWVPVSLGAAAVTVVAAAAGAVGAECVAVAGVGDVVNVEGLRRAGCVRGIGAGFAGPVDVTVADRRLSGVGNSAG